MRVLLEHGERSEVEVRLEADRGSRQDPAEVPDPGRQLFDAVLGGMQQFLNGALALNDALLNLARLALADHLQSEKSGPGLRPPVPILPPEHLPFNGPLSGEHEFNWLRIPLAAARSIRSTLKGSINDVILTIIGGAINSYLVEIGHPVAGRLSRVMVPVNIRSTRIPAVGNDISFLPVEIPLDLPDQRRLFEAISRQTSLLKQSRMAEMVSLLISGYGTLPAPLQAAVGAATPADILPFNLISTNVPGPPEPLYTLGKRLLAQYPYVPIAYSIGLGIATLSYHEDLCLGITSDRQAFPDAARMRDLLFDSFERLLAAARAAD
jgi:diacylglycerol O-acyltransferase / wax synthase